MDRQLFDNPLTLPNVRIRKFFQKVRVPCTSLVEPQPLLSGELSLKSIKASFSSMKQLKQQKPPLAKFTASNSLSRLQNLRVVQAIEKPLPPQRQVVPLTKNFSKLTIRRVRTHKSKSSFTPDASIQITRLEVETQLRSIKRPSSPQGDPLSEINAALRIPKPKPRTKVASDEKVPKIPTTRQEWAFVQQDL